MVLIIFTFPILYLSIALGYAYSKAWSQPKSSLTELIGEHSLVNTIIAFSTALLLITFAVMLGALIAFLISRYWLGKTIKKRVLRNHRSFAAVDSVVTESGWKTVLLLRLTPVPYSIMSYFLGVTKVKLRDYLLGT